MAKKQNAPTQLSKGTATKAKVVIEVGGGLIRQVVGNGVDMDIAVVDYNADDVDPEELIMCPALSGDGVHEETYAVAYEPEEDAQRVEDIFEAIAKSQPIHP